MRWKWLSWANQNTLTKIKGIIYAADCNNIIKKENQVEKKIWKKREIGEQMRKWKCNLFLGFCCEKKTSLFISLWCTFIVFVQIYNNNNNNHNELNRSTPHFPQPITFTKHKNSSVPLNERKKNEDKVKEKKSFSFLCRINSNLLKLYQRCLV